MGALSNIQLFLIWAFLIASAGGLTCLMKRLGVIDEPNHRSSHERPIPRSGGVAIVLATFAGLALIFWVQGAVPASFPQLAGMAIGAVVLAFAGLLDDLGRLSSFKSKLAWQTLGCCVLFPFGLVVDTVPVPLVGTVSLGWFGYPVTLLWVLGLTNIFNFMDGLDGLAAGTALVVAALMVMLTQGAGPVGAIHFALTATVLGFLVFNFPRAQIFLGDVGSQFLGFVFAAASVLAAGHDPLGIPILVMPLLFFHFIFDTSFTFCRRLLAGENVTQAHKSHLYQLLNQSGQSHARVSLIHFAMALAQGGGAYVMLRLPPARQWDVFLPFLVVEILYAVLVMRTARRRGAV